MVENNVKEYRRKAGLTLAELAEKSGIPVTTISDVERGAEPKVITALRIAEALGVSVERLWPL